MKSVKFGTPQIKVIESMLSALPVDAKIVTPVRPQSEQPTNYGFSIDPMYYEKTGKCPVIMRRGARKGFLCATPCPRGRNVCHHHYTCILTSSGAGNVDVNMMSEEQREELLNTLLGLKGLTLKDVVKASMGPNPQDLEGARSDENPLVKLVVGVSSQDPKSS